MDKTLQKIIIVVLVLAFTPLAFTLMPLVCFLVFIGGLYWLVTGWKKEGWHWRGWYHHHHHHHP